jgi:hypothetical protein
VNAQTSSLPGSLDVEQIDGEETTYVVEGDWITGPCPGCFLKYRKRRTVAEAVELSTHRFRFLRDERIYHLGCGTWRLSNGAWLEVR